MKKHYGGKKGLRQSKVGKGRRALREIEGTLQGTTKGYGFVITANGDCFIPAAKMKGAINGDYVSAVTDGNEGEIVSIIKPNLDPITGYYVKTAIGGIVTPDDKRYPFSVTVTGGEAISGDKVLVELSRKDRRKGVVLKSLGQAGSLDTDVAAVVAKLGLGEFRQKVVKEAFDSANAVHSIDGRADYRSQRCFTVDGDGSKDFDDAVFAERTELGYRLYVHIADVSEYVAEKGFCDREAKNRAFSFYYGDNVEPMLPESLCNGACSLNENVDRLTLTAVMDITDGAVVGGTVQKSVIRSCKRMTYSAVTKVLDGISVDGYTADMKDTLTTLEVIAEQLKKQRDSEGNIDFDLPETEFTFDDGKVVDMKKAERTKAHTIIEECMIAANRLVAKIYGEKGLFVFRSHQPPSMEKMQTLNGFLSACGLKPLPEKPTSHDVADMLGNVDEDKKECVSMVTLRSMSKANYSPSDSEHFGLAAKEYCHFTSPIRRYTDLVVHRKIKSVIEGKEFALKCDDVAEICRECNEREKKIADAEREIDDLYAQDYMYDKVGTDFDGVISGVNEWGFYVRLECTAEGLVRAESLNGRTKFDERSMSLRCGSGVYRIGDKVGVRLVGVSYNGLDFELRR